MKTNQATQIEVLGDCTRGIYLPQFIAKNYGSRISGIPQDTIPTLLAGPDGGTCEAAAANCEAYGDAWDELLQDGILTAATGAQYRIWVNENGDALGIPLHWEHDAVLGWTPPESDTLRRYDLPAHWACELVNGLDDGLEEAERTRIGDFLETEGLLDWTLSDISDETWFKRNPDGGGLACNVSRFTFVRI